MNRQKSRLPIQQVDALAGNQLVQLSTSDLAALLQTKQTQMRLVESSEVIRDVAQQVTHYAVTNGCQVEFLLIDNLGGE